MIKFVLLSMYSAAVAYMYRVDLCKLNCKWIVKTVLIMGVPLYEQIMDFSEEEDIIQNYILAPVFEEIVFRGPRAGYLASSICFSLAHLHTAHTQKYDLYHSFGQLIVTFLFGLYAYHVYTTTGSITTCMIIHGICNYAGLPSQVSLVKILIQSALVTLAILI